MRYSILKEGSYDDRWVLDFYEQAGIWWGGNPDGLEEYVQRVKTVEAEMGKMALRVLDLGAGTMGTAAAFAIAGHEVTAIELSPVRAALGKDIDLSHAKGSISMVVGDYYRAELGGGFDAVCCWDGFGVGSDSDQRRLLRRISGEWLKDGGLAFIDVFNTYFLSRLDGAEEHLDALEGVPSSVEMTRKAHFDPINCIWIDEWEPVLDKSASLSQAIRCYSPADFLLLLEGTGLEAVKMTLPGEQLPLPGENVEMPRALKNAYEYLTVLKKRSP